MNTIQGFDTNTHRARPSKALDTNDDALADAVDDAAHDPLDDLTRWTDEPVEVPPAVPQPNASRDLRGLELIMAELQVPDLIIGEVVGPLDEQVLRKAASRVQARHPGLRALVERPTRGRPRFKYFAPDPDRVEVSEVTSDDGLEGDSSRPRWQRVAEREGAHRFNLARRFGFRVSWVPSGDGGHLIVNAPHAVVDGVSLMRLMNEILQEAANVVATGTPPQVVGLAPTPAVLDQVSLGLVESAIGRVSKHVTLYQQKTYARRSLLPIADRLRPGDLPRASAVFHVGKDDCYERVVATCKNRGATVGCLYTAAVEFAVLRYLFEEKGHLPMKRNGVRLPISMDFSLRRLIEGASRTQDSIGLFTGVADVGITAPRDVTLWELARRFVANSRLQIHRRVPLLFHKALDSMVDLAAELRSYGVSYEESGGVADGVNVSSVGTYPYPTQHGAFSLRNVFGLNGALSGGPMLIFWLRSVNGRFCYNATAANPACDRARAERIFSYVVDVMENAASGAFDTLSLEVYAAGRGRR
jgi:hypothetical protein